MKKCKNVLAVLAAIWLVSVGIVFTSCSEYIVDSEETSKSKTSRFLKINDNGVLVSCSTDISGDLVIPDSVKKIGTSAFQGCRGLRSVTIPEGVTHIGVSAFKNCSGLKSVTISSAVWSIGGDAFYGCTGLTSVTMSTGVSFIGCEAFKGCNSLQTISYSGTMAQWNGIDVEYGYYNSLADGTQIKCTDGTLTYHRY